MRSAVVCAIVCLAPAGGIAGTIEDAEWLFGNADNVFECNVESLGPCVGVYSGMASVYQDIRCVVGEVYKGHMSAGTATVKQEIVDGSWYLKPDMACIDPKILTAKRHLIAFVNDRKGILTSESRGLVIMRNHLLSQLRSWRDGCAAITTEELTGVSWSTNPRNELVFTKNHATIGKLNRTLLGNFIARPYAIHNVQVRSGTGMVAFELHSEELDWSIIVVGDVRNRCPAREITPVIDWSSGNKGDLHPGSARGPQWVSDTRVAFMVGSPDNTNRAVFVADVSGGPIEVVRINAMPESIFCAKEVLRYRSASGEGDCGIPCE